MELLNNVLAKATKARDYIEKRGVIDLLMNLSSNRKEFLISQIEFEKFLNNYDFDKIKNKSEGGKAGIVVTPWMGTAVPWFAVTVALLYREYNLNCCIIWDDLLFYNEKATGIENKAIAEILEKFDDFIEIIKISEMDKCELDAKDMDEIKRLAILNSVHDFQSSIPTEESIHYQDLITNSLQNNLPKIKNLLKQYDFDHLVVPGGIWGNSGLYYWAGNLYNTRIVSYDCGSGVALIGTDNVATHLMDIPKLLKSNEIFQTDKVKNKACALARQELILRMRGNDKFSSQHIPVTSKTAGLVFDILIPLNIDWDSAALGQHRFFDLTYHWLIETVRFILAETSATVAVRQHPAEKKFTSGAYLEQYFNNMFETNARCRFFPCHEEVNTYDLLNNCDLVLPYTSTVGVEAAMLGKKVVVESNCYYSEMPFVQKAISKQDYYKQIRKYLNEKTTLDAKMIEYAEICYYFTQVCNWTFTGFTPNMMDFQKWSKSNFNQIFNDDTVKDIIMSFSNGVPIAMLRSKHILDTQ